MCGDSGSKRLELSTENTSNIREMINRSYADLNKPNFAKNNPCDSSLEHGRGHDSCFVLGRCRGLPPAMETIIKSQQTATTQICRLESCHYEDKDLASTRPQHFTQTT